MSHKQSVLFSVLFIMIYTIFRSSTPLISSGLTGSHGICYLPILGCILRGGGGGGRRTGSQNPPSLGKSQVAIDFLRTSLEKQLDPSGPIASRRRFVRPSVNYVDYLKTEFYDPPLHLPGVQHVTDDVYYSLTGAKLSE